MAAHDHPGEGLHAAKWPRLHALIAVNVLPSSLPGVLLVKPDVFYDARGLLFESYHADRYAAAGISTRFVQDNHSRSEAQTLRGLHYQLFHPQGKLVQVTLGTIFDVAVDIRRGSPTFGRWVSTTLSAENRWQLYIPPGFAHGFYVAEGPAEVEYKCTDYYRADDQYGIRWNDPTLAIAWPGTNPILSERDQRSPLLALDRGDLPIFDK